jgi:hypothetical protein
VHLAVSRAGRKHAQVGLHAAQEACCSGGRTWQTDQLSAVSSPMIAMLTLSRPSDNSMLLDFFSPGLAPGAAAVPGLMGLSVLPSGAASLSGPGAAARGMVESTAFKLRVRSVQPPKKQCAWTAARLSNRGRIFPVCRIQGPCIHLRLAPDAWMSAAVARRIALPPTVHAGAATARIDLHVP